MYLSSASPNAALSVNTVSSVSFSQVSLTTNFGIKIVPGSCDVGRAISPTFDNGVYVNPRRITERLTSWPCCLSASGLLGSGGEAPGDEAASKTRQNSDVKNGRFIAER